MTVAVTVQRADLSDPAHAGAVVMLLDAYAHDPRGGGEALAPAVRSGLIDGLRGHPTTRVWLAFDSGQPVGLCIAFVGFSTFNARPLLNLHDVAVLATHRGRGIGRALLQAAEAEARNLGCCRLTLEVQEDNTPARSLYERFGFRDVTYGDSGPTRFLGKPLRD